MNIEVFQKKILEFTKEKDEKRLQIFPNGMEKSDLVKKEQELYVLTN